MRGLLHTGHLTDMLERLAPTATLGQLAMRQETKTAPSDESAFYGIFNDVDSNEMPPDGRTDDTHAADAAESVRAVEQGVDASAIHRTGESVAMESIFHELMRQETKTAPSDESAFSGIFNDVDGNEMPPDGRTDDTHAADAAESVRAVEQGVDASTIHRTGESVTMESIFHELMSLSAAVESLSKRVELGKALCLVALNLYLTLHLLLFRQSM